MACMPMADYDSDYDYGPWLPMAMDTIVTATMPAIVTPTTILTVTATGTITSVREACGFVCFMICK